MVKGAIFDMDGLMFDTERLWDTLWAPCCGKLGLPLPPPEFLAAGRGLAGDNLKRHLAKFYPQIDPEVMLQEVWRLADERFGQGVPCKPGLRELLDWLRDHNIPCIVASSSPRNMIEMNLKNTGVDGYFKGVVCGADVEHSKPEPDIFLLAARQLGLDARDCLVLEDSFNGVRAGRAAGAVTVMVPDMAQPDEEMRSLYTCCCHDLLEVRDLLEEGKL